MSKLKPCPFCGGKPKLIDNFIVCEGCATRMERAIVYPRWHESTELIQRWNTRAERTCVPRVVPRSFAGDSEPSFYQAICDCGWIVGEDGASSLSDFEHVDPYCGGCGAKVVVE